MVTGRGRRSSLLLQVAISFVSLWLGATGPVSVAHADSYADRDAAATESSGWGPLNYTTQSPFQAFRFTFLHTRPEPYAPGTVAAFTSLTWTNLFAYEPHRYMLQGETIQSNLYLLYGISSAFDVSLRVPLIYLTGGIMDPLIEGFHHDFGLGNENRERFPKNQVNIQVQTPQGDVLLADGSNKGLYIRAPVVSGRWHLRARTWPLTLTASVDAPPLQSPGFYPNGNDPDWALGVATAQRFGDRFALTLSTAYIRQRASLPNFLDHGQSTLVALNYRIDDQWGAIVQAINETAVAEGSGSNLDRPSTEAQAGVQWLIWQNYRAEAAMIEKLSYANNSIDWGLHFAISTLRGPSTR